MGSLRELVSVVSIFEAVSVAKTVTNSSSKSIGEAVDMAVPIVAVVVAVGVDLPSEHAGAAAEARVVLVGAVPCLHDQVAVGKTGIIRASVWNMDGVHCDPDRDGLIAVAIVGDTSVHPTVRIGCRCYEKSVVLHDHVMAVRQEGLAFVEPRDSRFWSTGDVAVKLQGCSNTVLLAHGHHVHRHNFGATNGYSWTSRHGAVTSPSTAADHNGHHAERNFPDGGPSKTIECPAHVGALVIQGHVSDAQCEVGKHIVVRTAEG